MKHFSLFIAAVLFVTVSRAQTYQERAQQYIDRYKALAIAEQQRTGVPAAIKLGQGILETNAGNSELLQNAHNHFGIKCKSNWAGETYTYTDDAPDECFRKYGQDIESYRDHSDFLVNNKRYASCFLIPQTDYQSWARELRKCGYATNPKYAAQLIKIIEDFNLQEVTYAALSPATESQSGVLLASAAPVPGSTNPSPPIALTAAPEPPKQQAFFMAADKDTVKFAAALPFGRRMSKNGLDGFYARKGELLLESAIKFNIRYARLLELNDLQDAPLPADMFIYLEKKKSTGSRPSHVVAAGESMLYIAQEEGIQLKTLYRLNQIAPGEEPAAGTVLQLQQAAQVKPAVATHLYAAPRAEVFTKESNLVAGGKKTANAAGADVKQPEAMEPVQETPASEQQAEPAPVNIADEQAVEEGAQDAQPEEVALGYGAAPATGAGDEIDQLKARMDKAVYTQPAPAEATPALPAKPLAEAGSAQAQYHTVAAGETAFSIARKYNITMKQLIDWNQLDFGKIKVGQKLRVK